MEKNNYLINFSLKVLELFVTMKVLFVNVSEGIISKRFVVAAIVFNNRIIAIM